MWFPHAAASRLPVPPVDCVPGQPHVGLQTTRAGPGHEGTQSQLTIWLSLQLKLFKYLFSTYLEERLPTWWKIREGGSQLEDQPSLWDWKLFCSSYSMCRAHSARLKFSASWPSICGRQFSDHLLDGNRWSLRSEREGFIPSPSNQSYSFIKYSSLHFFRFPITFQCPNEILAPFLDCSNCWSP